MEQKYSEIVTKNFKYLFHNKYFLKLLVILFLTLSISTVSVFSNYRAIQDQISQKEIVETDNSENTEDSIIPVPDNIEETTEEEKIEEQKKENLTNPSKETTTSGSEIPEQPVIPDGEPDEQISEKEPEEVPAPPESPSAVVAFYADTQSDSDQEDLNHQRVVSYILSSGANPIFHAGDVMEDGTQLSLNRFNTVSATLRSTRTFYAALGNNDRKEGDASTPSQLFLDNFVFPNNEHWYSVNYGNLHLIVLDSAFSAGNATQLNWLASDLQSNNSQNRITGVMYHHPTFASTVSSSLINYGADFVIAGHVHSYSHSVSNGINYFTLSGQPSIGYIVARIYSNTVTITVYNSGNGVIDSVQFSER